MPLIPSAIERFLFLTLNQAPTALIDVLSATGLRIVLLAADIGVFEALQEGPLSVDQLAAKLATNREGLAVLLPVLESFGYVSEKGSAYSNTRQTSRWLLSYSPDHILDFLRWWKEIVYRYWDEYLDVSIRGGESSPDLYEWISEQPDGWRIAQAGFEATARLALADVIKAVEIPGTATSLLDVGGGHGLYSVELCQIYPTLKATIFDFPEALGQAENNIHANNLRLRVDTRGGDYLKDDMGGPYDVALLFNVIHAHDQHENRDLLRRVAENLGQDGRIYIMDQMVEPTIGRVSAGAQRILSLAYHVGMGGKTYSSKEVSGWLIQSGYRNVSKRELRKAPGTVIVSASKANGAI
jgi:hypothetical protein